MLIVRPVRISDLPAIERLALASGVGVTSLPANREKLFEKLQRSISSFESEAIADIDAGNDYYMLVLEEDGVVLGAAAIASTAGFDEPFYTYRNETLVHASRALKVNNRIHALTMCHDLTGMVQLCGFFCEHPSQPYAAELLSRARLMFLAGQRQHFGRRIIAEMLGVHDVAGQSPFWDAIGRRFFNMDFPQVEQAFAEHSKTFVAELMPPYPIYVPLLPDAAQHAIGQVHPAFEQPCRILTREGFEADQYLDIFDGGAVLTAEIDRLFTLNNSDCMPVEISASLPDSAEDMLLSNTLCSEFRSAVGKVAVVDGVAWLNPDVARALDLACGQSVRISPLQGE
ncbi:arginine/ornithine succinyltransferase subunit alpha [Aquitalea sp. S1-19]|nr:arginine/ornithine succinyltransferase subunit alpha [Aquitalea sp. S1-19]